MFREQFKSRETFRHEALLQLTQSKAINAIGACLLKLEKTEHTLCVERQELLHARTKEDGRWERGVTERVQEEDVGKCVEQVFRGRWRVLLRLLLFSTIEPFILPNRFTLVYGRL